MNQITIICSDPIVEKLLHYITAELPEHGEQVVLLDAAMMEQLPKFSGAKVILFSDSADPGILATGSRFGKMKIGKCPILPFAFFLGKGGKIRRIRR